MNDTIENIYPRVAHILADVLDVEEDEVKLQSFLMNDLDAESIDFLDITFRLEREFKVKIPRSGIEKAARGELSEEAFENKGVLTTEGLAALKAYLPEVPEEAFRDNLKVAEIPTLFTVETLCKFVQNVESKQQAKA